MTQNGPKKPWDFKNVHDLVNYIWQKPKANQQQLATAIGVSRRTLYRYWQDPDFEEAVNNLSRLQSSKHKNAIDHALVEKAKLGDVPAMRTFYQLRGELLEKLEHGGGVDLNISDERINLQRELAEIADKSRTKEDTEQSE